MSVFEKFLIAAVVFEFVCAVALYVLLQLALNECREALEGWGAAIRRAEKR